MPRQVFLFDPPERFVVGTIGPPGERAFFLQARSAARVVSVALEKQQVSVLAERLGELLDEVVRRSAGSAPVPAVSPADLADAEPLDQPVLEEFRVGTLALAWDAEAEIVIIEALALSESTGDEDESASDVDIAFNDDESADGPDVLRVRMTGAQARAFVERAQRVVNAGRPPCPFCGLPLDSGGHVCPRQNGYRR
jgi:uncharacterized repeat protein (TIGR03847 family)